MSYAVSREILEARGRVFAHEIDGEKVYVKKIPRDGVFWTRPLSRAGYALTGRLLRLLTGNTLIPPFVPLRKGECPYEVRILGEMAAKGLNVPAVLHYNDDYFVMSDVGVSLEQLLRERPKERETLVDGAAVELRRLHDLGFAHGGNQVRNMSLKDGQYYFLDFEEVILTEHLSDMRIRDLFLFLFSLERCGFDPDVKRLLAVYNGRNPCARTVRFLDFLRRIGLVRICEWRLFNRLRIRDLRALSQLVRKAGLP